MSIKIMTQVWENGPEKQGHLLVLLAISDYANDEGLAWPSMKSIAKKSRMLERSAQRVVRQLESDGWLKIDTGNGRHGCNEYHINPVNGTPSERHPVLKTPRPKRQKPRPKVQETPSHGTPEPLRTVKEPSIGRLTPQDVLSEVLSRDVAEGFCEMRKAIKKPLTEYAAKLIVKQLKGNPKADEIVSESIKFSWQGIFPEKFAGSANQSSSAEKIKRWERMGR